MPLSCGRLAQLVEQLTLNQRVAGSNPAAPTSKSLDFLIPQNLVKILSEAYQKQMKKLIPML